MRLHLTFATYISRQFLGCWFGVFLALMALIAMFDTIEIMRRGANIQAMSIANILTLVFFKLPHLIQKAIPFTILFGAMLAFWRLNRHHELVVARSAGLSAWEFLAPVLIVTILIGVIKITVYSSFASAMMFRYEQLENKYFPRKFSLATLSGKGLWLRQKVKNGHYLLHSPKIISPNMVLEPVTIFKFVNGDNFSSRIDRISTVISETGLRGKMNGAVGNYNAHLIAYPKVDWEKVSKTFITKVGLLWSPYTTQVEPKDSMAKLFHGHERLNNVLLDFSRDMWGYISLDYFSQKTIKGEVGSSTMPHKINPIDFENAEGNLDLANSIFHYLSSKITKSRWQRDLSDSTSMRNIGSCFAYTLIALSSLIKGLNKLQINKKVINQDLENAWEVLTEAIQTVMRKHHMEGGYEVMKKISRGKNIKKEDLHAIINSLDIPSAEKNKLLKLTPSTYLGLSNKLAKQI